MDAKELMIGDWVHLKYSNPYGSADEYVQIDGILAKECANQFGGNGTIWGTGHGNLGNGEDLFPIPITQEILEKNGFMYGTSKARQNFESILLGKCEYNLSDKKWHTPYEEIKLKKRIEEFDGGEIVIWDIEDFVGIEYVHELQHALRLCGLAELANSFKV